VSTRHPIHFHCGHGIWCSRRPRHGFFCIVGKACGRLNGCTWTSCWPVGAERFLSPFMSLTRTSCADCPPPWKMWRPLLPRLGCLLLPRRSSPAPWAASVSVLPRAAREAPLFALACCVMCFQRCVGLSCVLLCFIS
jgi:hypothetical protein